MRVTVIGCGDAFGSGGRNNTAILIEAPEAAGGPRVCMLDCGATTMTALNAMGMDPDRIDMIALTHLHGDHFGGIPFLLLDAQWVRKRKRPLRIVGPPGTHERLLTTLEVLFEGTTPETKWSFDWQVEEMEPGSQREFDGVTVHTVRVPHGVGTPATAVRVEIGGKAIVHSGDTEWTDALPRIAAGADLLFIECFAVEETPPHLDYTKLLAHRAEFDAKHMVLTHMGPKMLDFRDQVDLTLFELAEDGQVFEL